MSNGNDVLEGLEMLIDKASERCMNEADTRHKIIDFILHDYLAWPRNRVSTEEYINPGFADYILKKTNGDDLLIVESKKEGVFFSLPIPYNQEECSCFMPIKKLLGDENIKLAMSQVRGYCNDSGCEYACITNGHEWIFFKTFERGRRWDTIQAFIIRNLRFFLKEYTKAINNFSFVAITEHASLPALLNSVFPKDRGIFFPKEKIPSYSHTINANRLAPSLRPIINTYFGVISDNDTAFSVSKSYSDKLIRVVYITDGIINRNRFYRTPYCFFKCLRGARLLPPDGLLDF